MVSVQVLSPLSTKFPSPSLYTTPFTSTVKSSAESEVPVIVGVLSLVTSGSTVGTVGAVVSIVNSSVVASVEVLPAASVAIAITS